MKQSESKTLPVSLSSPLPVFRRLSQVIISIALLVTVLNMWITTSNNVSEAQSHTLSDLTRQLTQQSSLVAVRLIEKKQWPQLTLMLNDLLANRYIEQAVIYDNNGKILAQSDGALSVHQTHLNNLKATRHEALIDAVVGADKKNTLTTEKPAAAVNEPSTVYITALKDKATKHSIIGYLRINYHRHAVLKKPQEVHKSSMNDILLMMILSGVIGFMLTRGFSRFSRLSLKNPT